MRYAQTVLEKFPKVGVVQTQLLLHRWYLKKAKELLPDFQLANASQVHESHILDFKNDLLIPNLRNYSVFVTQGYQSTESFHVTYYGLGRKISDGSGTSTSEGAGVKVRTHHSLPPEGPQSYSRAKLYSEYSHVFLAKGLLEFRNDKKSDALASWERALEIVPFAYPALENICKTTASHEPRCNSTYLEKVKQRWYF